ncbi:MAG: hypothetical protein RL497_2373 [Pseudomonadota bacterium]
MKILYGVQGTGNGHISRARALNHELSALGAEISFVFSGREPGNYFGLEEFRERRFQHGLQLAYAQGKVDIMQTWHKNKLGLVYNEIHDINTREYDLVISDFEPITAWAAKLQHQKCLTLGHQYAFLHNIPKASDTLFSRQLLKSVAPSELALGLHWHHFNQTILPPIIHNRSSVRSEHDYYLVYLPFEDRQDIIDFLEPLESESFICFGPYSSIEKIGNIIFRPCSAVDFHPALCGARGVVCNAGFELVSEALQLGIKLLVKPLQGQMEQVSNGRALVELGLGMYMPVLDRKYLSYWLNNYQPRQITYPNVAQAIAQWIVSGAYNARDSAKEISSLATSLWDATDFKHTPWLKSSIKNAA